MLVAQCPGCKKKYKAPENAAGRKLKCPVCGASFMILKPKVEDPETDFDLGPASNSSPQAATAAKEDSASDRVASSSPGVKSSSNPAPAFDLAAELDAMVARNAPP